MIISWEMVMQLRDATSFILSIGVGCMSRDHPFRIQRKIFDAPRPVFIAEGVDPQRREGM